MLFALGAQLALRLTALLAAGLESPPFVSRHEQPEPGGILDGTQRSELDDLRAVRPGIERAGAPGEALSTIRRGRRTRRSPSTGRCPAVDACSNGYKDRRDAGAARGRRFGPRLLKRDPEGRPIPTVRQSVASGSFGAERLFMGQGCAGPRSGPARSAG